MNQTNPSDLVMLIGADRKQFIFRLQPDAELQTHRGVIRHNALIGLPWGSEVHSHLGSLFYLVEPTLHDLLLHMRRRSQILFPKDIGYVLLRLSVGAGKTIIEAGTGSGALTTALAWAVGPTGHVFSYDRRQDMQDLAADNLKRVGLADRVTLRLVDIDAGFLETDVDAVFLDLPNPHDYLEQVRTAIRTGGALGAILPTMNQVSTLLASLGDHHYGYLEACEILLRFYKTVPARMRPTDRMVAHTGYLVFARAMLPGAEVGPVPEAIEGEENPFER
jgi:tRNA (adenine57-N1/adenine58-N1)-methyltransferase